MQCLLPRFPGSAPSLGSLFSYLSYCIHISNIPYEAMIYIYWSRNLATCHQTVEKANQIIYQCVFILKLTALPMNHSIMYQCYLSISDLAYARIYR